MSEAVERCVRNSLHWYESVFRAHRLSGAIVDGLWVSHDEAPPYHSNAMTLSRGPIDAQLSALRDLRSELPGSWSIKDCFAMLDLGRLGFEPLFDAEWISRESSSADRASNDDVTWRRVTSPAELDAWDVAWRAHGSPSDRPVFVPALLSDPTIAVFGAYRGGVLVAGCAANRSADAVGFSNLFTCEGDEDDLMTGGVAAVDRFGDGLPIVGFESGDTLDRAVRIGFQAVGPLRVWDAFSA